MNFNVLKTISYLQSSVRPVDSDSYWFTYTHWQAMCISIQTHTDTHTVSHTHTERQSDVPSCPIKLALDSTRVHDILFWDIEATCQIVNVYFRAEFAESYSSQYQSERRQEARHEWRWATGHPCWSLAICSNGSCCASRQWYFNGCNKTRPY